MSYTRHYFEDQKPKYNSNKTKRNTHKLNGVLGSRPLPVLHATQVKPQVKHSRLPRGV